MKTLFMSIAIVWLIPTSQIFAQTTSNNTDCSKNPCWIKMMNDTSANYFETVKAFDTFWEGKEIPRGEEEEIGENIDPAAKDQERGEDSEAKEKHCWFSKKMKEKDEETYESYRFEVKKFYHWQEEVLPYVQEDGHILTPTERLKIWNR